MRLNRPQNTNMEEFIEKLDTFLVGNFGSKQTKIVILRDLNITILKTEYRNNKNLNTVSPTPTGMQHKYNRPDSQNLRVTQQVLTAAIQTWIVH